MSTESKVNLNRAPVVVVLEYDKRSVRTSTESKVNQSRVPAGSLL